MRTAANNGFGIGRIPFDKIDYYMKREGIPVEQRDFYRSAIMTIDRLFVEYESRQEARKAGAAGNNPPPGKDKQIKRGGLR